LPHLGRGEPLRSTTPNAYHRRQASILRPGRPHQALSTVPVGRARRRASSQSPMQISSSGTLRIVASTWEMSSTVAWEPTTPSCRRPWASTGSLPPRSRCAGNMFPTPTSMKQTSLKRFRSRTSG